MVMKALLNCEAASVRNITKSFFLWLLSVDDEGNLARLDQ
jgi:hypothetical protein